MQKGKLTALLQHTVIWPYILKEVYYGQSTQYELIWNTSYSKYALMDVRNCNFNFLLEGKMYHTMDGIYGRFEQNTKTKYTDC